MLRYEFPFDVCLELINSESQLSLANFYKLISEINLGGARRVFLGFNDFALKDSRANSFALKIKQKTIAKTSIVTDCSIDIKYTHFTTIYVDIDNAKFNQKYFSKLIEKHPRRVKAITTNLQDNILFDGYSEYCKFIEYQPINKFNNKLKTMCMVDLKNTLLICLNGDIIADIGIIGNINDDSLINIWGNFIINEGNNNG